MGRSRDINAENVGGHSMIEVCSTDYKIISVEGHYMIEVSITEQMRKNALLHAMKDKARYGSYNAVRGIYSDKTRYIGSLGEEVISSYFNTKLEHLNDNVKYDIIIKQQRVEIKSQNINSGIPYPRFECNIFTPSKTCDRYMFVFIHSSHTKAWIVGTCSKEEFDYKSYISFAKIKGRKPHRTHHIKIKDLEDVISWQSKFGRTVKDNGLMPRQVGL